MSSMETQRRESGGSRQGRAWAHLLAIVLGVIPLYSGTIIFQLRGGLEISLKGFVTYLAVISPLSIVIVLLLLRYLCGESPRALNLKPGRVSSDLLAALILCPVIIAANIIGTFLASGLAPESADTLDDFVIHVSAEQLPAALRIVHGLRSLGRRVGFDYRSRGIGRQFKVANQAGAKRVIVVGPEEVEQGEFVVRSMETGEETRVRLDLLLSDTE